MPNFIASDGTSIAYSDDGAGTPIILLHGLLAHRGFFKLQAPLAETHRLIAVDLRGHGDSIIRDGKVSVDRLAADVTELVEALDLENVIGVGWSLGATVLWHVLSGSAAARFSGSVVVDMTARVRNDSEWTLGLSPETCDARSAAIRDDFPTFALGAGQAIFAQPVSDGHRDLAAWASAEFARSDPEAMASVWTSLVGQDLRALLGDIHHPTLVVHGAQSTLYGDDTASHLVASLPSATAIKIEGSGHAPHLEQPALFNRTLREFADRLSRARPTIASVR